MFDKEYSQKKAQQFVTALFQEVPEHRREAVERTLYGILRRTETCRNIIAKMDQDADVTRVLKNMVRSLQSLLQETDNATLRTFLFTCPKRQDRALQEISARLSTLEWICREIRRQRQERIQRYFTRLDREASHE